MPDLKQVVNRQIRNDEINISDILRTGVNVIMPVTGNNHSCVIVSDIVIPINENGSNDDFNFYQKKFITGSVDDLNKKSSIGEYLSITKCWGLNN